MIRFICGKCGVGYKVGDQYAGRKVRCKGCQHINRVPSAGDADKAKVFFNCTMCDGKLETKASMRGKSVECSQCGCMAEVPLAKDAPVIGSGGGLGKVTARIALENNSPVIKTVELEKSEDVQRQPMSAHSGHQGEEEAGDKVWAGILLSFGLSLAGAFVWFLVARLTMIEFGILILLSGILAGVGFTVYVSKRIPIYGLLVASIGLCCMITGRLFVVKYVVKPAMKIEFGRQLESVSSDKFLLGAMKHNPTTLFASACIAKTDQGEVETDLTWPIIIDYAKEEIEKKDKERQMFDKLWQMLAENLDVGSAADRQEEIAQGRKLVLGYIDDIGEKKKNSTVRANWDEIVAKALEVLDETGEMGSIAFRDSFGVFDLGFIAFGLVVAFRIAAGNFGEFSES